MQPGVILLKRHQNESYATRGTSTRHQLRAIEGCEESYANLNSQGPRKASAVHRDSMSLRTRGNAHLL
jgi:hypothetical protein